MEAQKSYGRWDMAPGDVLYPLRAASDTGHGTLHVLGDPTALADEAMVTVVGSMRETPYGAAVSEMIGRTAADLGIVLVCDQTRGCAHDAARAALDSGGRVVLVAGCGADVDYPRAALDVRDDALARGGAVVSLEEWGTPPQRGGFRRKLGLSSALTPATLVAQAGVPSAAYSAAVMASEMGRDVLAVPGSVFDPAERGANDLVARGVARAVTGRDHLVGLLCAQFSLEVSIAPSQDRETPAGRPPEPGDSHSEELRPEGVRHGR